MFGNKILLATPLLRYYLYQGFDVKKIYQVIEYEPRACFKSVGERVCDARRAGDADPNMAIIIVIIFIRNQQITLIQSSINST